MSADDSKDSQNKYKGATSNSGGTAVDLAGRFFAKASVLGLVTYVLTTYGKGISSLSTHILYGKIESTYSAKVSQKGIRDSVQTFCSKPAEVLQTHGRVLVLVCTLNQAAVVHFTSMQYSSHFGLTARLVPIVDTATHPVAHAATNLPHSCIPLA